MKSLLPHVKQLQVTEMMLISMIAGAVLVIALIFWIIKQVKKYCTMNHLSVSILIIPLIALLLAVAGYIILHKQATDKAAFNRLTVAIIGISLLLNFAWEMLQMPFFKGMDLNWRATVFCAVASVADTLMVMLLYLGFAIIYKESFWVKQMSWQRILLLILVGFIGAVLAELKHTSAGDWSYSNYMPVLPVLGVGIVPLLQFMVLPAIIYFLSFKIIRHE